MDTKSDSGLRIRDKLSSIDERKQHIYKLSLVFAFLILLLSWVGRAPGDAFVTFLYPVFCLIVLVLFLLLWWKKTAVRKLEPVILLVISFIILARLGWLFHLSAAVDDRLLLLAGGHYWAVASLIVGTFVMLDGRWGPVAGVTIILVSILIAVSGITTDLIHGQITRETIVYLVRIHLFLFLLIVLTSAVGTMREDLHNALSSAGVLDRLAHTDTLTGLANRRIIDRSLEHQIAAAARLGRPLSVILTDLDNFKEINDTLGHPAGDAVLVEAARRLGGMVRESDMLGRWGGDEFIITASDTDIAAALGLAERLRRNVAETPFPRVGRVTVSLGVAEMQEGDTKDRLIGRADRAMYEGKSGGRNRAVSG